MMHQGPLCLFTWEFEVVEENGELDGQDDCSIRQLLAVSEEFYLVSVSGTSRVSVLTYFVFVASNLKGFHYRRLAIEVIVFLRIRPLWD
jgi:hypothetical protein